MKTQKGFTLIELIIVIVVLGILAVTAAPQFFNFSSDARTSTLQGLEASIKGANQLTYGKAAIAAALEGEGTVTIRNGITVNTFNGYLKAASVETAVDAGDFTFVEKTAGDYNESTAGAPDVPGVYVIAASDIINAADPNAPTSAEVEATNCFITYTDSESAGAIPEVELEKSGC